ncbi:hypothetical protein QVD17_04889 [Tagetes erecta]|uniref:Uncharacterized protein n=1 Tax=Tagetes erecta TaxID=13708 RepID=A0AAD8LE07_TARER|nr:hypothetical protein QVD17_04889 [Tagetes erecta]
MGNTVAGAGKKKKLAKVMKIDGEIIKVKTPVKVFQVIKDYPGHVLLESKTFKQFGIRADPLDPEECLEAGNIYFLVELPKLPEKKEKPVVRAETGGSVRVKVRLAKAEVDKLIGESRDKAELTERIVEFCVKKKNAGDVGRPAVEILMAGGG